MHQYSWLRFGGATVSCPSVSACHEAKVTLTFLAPFWGRHYFEVSACHEANVTLKFMAPFWGRHGFDMVLVCNAMQGYHACKFYHEAIFMPQVQVHAHSCAAFEHNFGQTQTSSMFVTSSQLLQSGSQVGLKSLVYSK